MIPSSPFPISAKTFSLSDMSALWCTMLLCSRILLKLQLGLLRTSTSCPREVSSSTTWLPMKPHPPVTSIRIVFSSIRKVNSYPMMLLNPSKSWMENLVFGGILGETLAPYQPLLAPLLRLSYPCKRAFAAQSTHRAHKGNRNCKARCMRAACDASLWTHSQTAPILQVNPRRRVLSPWRWWLQPCVKWRNHCIPQDGIAPGARQFPEQCI